MKVILYSHLYNDAYHPIDNIKFEPFHDPLSSSFGFRVYYNNSSSGYAINIFYAKPYTITLYYYSDNNWITYGYINITLD